MSFFFFFSGQNTVNFTISRNDCTTSVNFTWRFSGDVAGTEFGFKATNAATIEKNGRILFLNTFGKTVYVHQSFTGRVTGSRSDNSSSGHVIFSLSGITLHRHLWVSILCKQCAR